MLGRAWPALSAGTHMDAPTSEAAPLAWQSSCNSPRRCCIPAQEGTTPEALLQTRSRPSGLPSMLRRADHDTPQPRVWGAGDRAFTRRMQMP